MGAKKHKKNKSERRERYEEYAQNPSLKLILKVGSNSTPEYGTDSPAGQGIGENSSGGSIYYSTGEPERHKKSKKKKKKKDREKKHKHHKEKRRHRHRDDSSQEYPALSPEAIEENILHFGDLKGMDCLAARPVTRPMIPMISPKSVSGHESDSQPLLSPSGSSTGGGVRGSLEKAGSESGREPRTCVLKMKQSKTPLGKVLDHVLRSIEKRDPQQYFAWPVTDDIAPGYSNIIDTPMDFSSMRQKIDDNQYSTMDEFADDFRLMCSNAITYNHVETVYHKAAKKLLQVGNKMLQPEALVRSLRSMMGHLRTLTEKELGFDLSVAAGEKDNQDTVSEPPHLDSADEGALNDETTMTGPENVAEKPIAAPAAVVTEPEQPERTEEEEILLQVQRARDKLNRERKMRRQRIAKMGFLRQNKDGTTSMEILVDVDGVCGPEQLISLGDLTGKLKMGTHTLMSFAREDTRNVARMVKPMDYGAYSSFAPIFDSRFANLTKEETQLIQNTYGDDQGRDYAESLMNFTKHSNVTSTMANRILDVLTNGEHSTAMTELMATHQPQFEEREVDRTLPDVEKEKSLYADVKVDYEGLKSLSELGIDTNFIDEWVQVEKCAELQQQLSGKLSANSTLLDRLHGVQYERLSQPLPHHLQLVEKARPNEVELAHQITHNLVDMAKKLTPEAIAPAPAIRKAMGVSCANLEDYAPKMNVYNLTGLKFAAPSAASSDIDTAEPMEIETESLVQHHAEDGVSMDLDNELRQFLEGGVGS